MAKEKTRKELEDEFNLQESRNAEARFEQLNFDADLQKELNKGTNAGDFEEWKKEFDKQMSVDSSQKSYLQQKEKEKAEAKELFEMKKKFYLGEKGAKTFDKLVEVKSASNIDPLAQMRQSVSTGYKTGKRGRPRKYAPTAPSTRPVGRPSKKAINLGGQSIIQAVSPRIIQREPYVPPTQTQMMVMDMFGDKQQTWGFGGNPVRINNRLGSGGGLLKSGDGGATRSFFGGFRR